ncbi:MAG: hypothetical protein AAGF77_13540 [Bacteroidota bacterium]
MKPLFEPYKDRSIQFHNWINIKDWNIKVYTISHQAHFSASGILKKALEQLPHWITAIEASPLPTYRNAFLIVHEAREGVWILLNWWTGGEMIETKVYLSSYSNPETIVDSPYNINGLLCVWELEVFAHERSAWIENILKKATDPDFNGYHKTVLTAVV